MINLLTILITQFIRIFYINISSELFKDKSDKLTFQDYVGGGLEVADRLLASIPHNMIITTDVKRKSIKYKGSNGMVNDPKGKNLLTMICKGIGEEAQKTVKTARDHINDVDNFDDLVKANNNVMSIKKGAKGDTETQFAKDLTKRIAQKTNVNKPQNITIDIIPLSQSDLLNNLDDADNLEENTKADFKKEVTYVDACCSPMSISSMSTDGMDEAVSQCHRLSKYMYEKVQSINRMKANKRSKAEKRAKYKTRYMMPYDSDSKSELGTPISCMSSIDSNEIEDFECLDKMQNSCLEEAKRLRCEYRNIKYKDTHPECYKYANSYLLYR